MFYRDRVLRVRSRSSLFPVVSCSKKFWPGAKKSIKSVLRRRKSKGEFVFDRQNFGRIAQKVSAEILLQEGYVFAANVLEKDFMMAEKMIDNVIETKNKGMKMLG